MKNKIDSKEIGKLYNKISGEDFEGDYEKNRWAGRVEQSRYKMMQSTISKLASGIGYNRYIELGPGPGTWTKLFLDRNSDKEHVLVDVSKEMLDQAKVKLKKYKKIRYIQSNFLDAKISGKFDFFFSSRAIEYVPNKEKTIAKIYNILEEGGSGAIITKTPYPRRDKIYSILGRKLRFEHKDQISTKRMKRLLKDAGFRNINFYPVIVEFPPSVRFNLPKLNWGLYLSMSNNKFGLMSNLISEAYLVTFKK